MDYVVRQHIEQIWWCLPQQCDNATSMRLRNRISVNRNIAVISFEWG